jgi:P-type conjugative transfer protein TrbG
VKPRTIVLLASALLAGCVAQQPAPQPLMPAELTNPAPPQIHVPPDPLDALSPAVREAYLRGSTKPIRDGISTIFPYSEHGRPVIYTSPLHVTEIVLGPGERLTTNTAIGDSERFSIEASGNTILIKPTPFGHAQQGSTYSTDANAKVPSAYSTNLVAETDKRSYHFIIQSTPKTWMEMEQVSFWFPEDITAARTARAAVLREATRQAAAPSPDQLNFSYKVTGPDVIWKPTQVFSDRSHTYIRFSDSAAQAGDLPALFSGDGKNQQVVNYQTRGNDTYVADRVLTKAALAEGQGVERTVVRIESTNGN